MATENTDTDIAVSDDVTPAPEHDYTTGAPAAPGAVGAEITPEQAPEAGQSVAQGVPEVEVVDVPVEDPGPAVGAEVDCPGGNEEEEAASSSANKGHGAPVYRVGRKRVKRADESHCTSCQNAFERQGRSFNRRAVYTFTSPATVAWLFPHTQEVHLKSFLCETCAQFIRSKCRRRTTGKRMMWLRPPAPKQSETKEKKKGSRMGKKSKAAALVSKSCYKAAFKMLWSAKGARKPMMDFWSKQLKEEMKALSRHADSPFHQKVLSRKPLSSFPWRNCLLWAQNKAPLVTACLTAMFPDITALSKSSHQLSEDQAQTLLERRAVVALSIPLFTRNIWKNNFLQAALGAELRLQGCSGSALDALNTMGLCQNKDTVRLLLNRLNAKKTNGAQNGLRLKRLKIKQEQLKGNIEEEEEEEEEEEDSSSSSSSSSSSGDDDDGNNDEDEDSTDNSDGSDEVAEVHQMEVTVEEEIEEEVVHERVQIDDEEEEEVEDVSANNNNNNSANANNANSAAAILEKAKEKEKRRKKKAKKKEKRKEQQQRGKRKAKRRRRGDGDGEEEEEGDDDDGGGGEGEEEGQEEGAGLSKKRRVVVVRLGLLKGHSEVGRSDLSAP